MTVIAHFPRLLDSTYEESLKSLLDEQPPDFPENEFRNGLQSLAPYLASVCLAFISVYFGILLFPFRGGEFTSYGYSGTDGACQGNNRTQETL